MEQSLKEEIKFFTSQVAEARENHLTLQTSETTKRLNHRGFEGELPTAGKPETASIRSKSTEDTST
jgi:hypothetical protein